MTASTTLNISFFLSFLCIGVPGGSALSRPVSASTVKPSCITAYTYRLIVFVSARRTRTGPGGRRLRENSKQLRVAELVDLEHRDVGSLHQHLSSRVRRCSRSFSLVLTSTQISTQFIVLKLVLAASTTLNIRFFLNVLCTHLPAGIASSRPVPASSAKPSCITAYAYRLRVFVLARHTRQGPGGRRLRESPKQLRVAGLMDLEHRDLGSLMHKLQHRRHSSCLLGEPGSSKCPRR